MDAEAVYKAASRGELGELQAAVRGFVGRRTAKGRTPLVGACERGHLSVVKFLVNVCKADVEQV